MTTQETINKAVAWATGIANDTTHGYDQVNRWGNDYDCSSFIITAWQAAGVPVKDTGASYTGNMYFAFIHCGFADVTNQVNLATGAALEKGDVLLNKAHHTEMYIGNGKVVKASINEKGTATGGQTGDQNGREIYIGSYYNYPWDCVLRYKGGEEKKEDKPLELPVLQKGDKGEVVRSAQILLIGRKCSCGIWGADGDFGNGTMAAVKAFQHRTNESARQTVLVEDGIIGDMTWNYLLGVL